MKKKVKGECFPGIRFLLLCAVMLAGLGLLLLPQAARAEGEPVTGGGVTFSVGGGTYDGPLELTISCDPGWLICYTTDGSSPSKMNGSLVEPRGLGYSNPVKISISDTCIIKATPYRSTTKRRLFDFQSGMSQTYIIKGSKVLLDGVISFSPGPDTFQGPQDVTVSGPEGFTICYTTDGSDPIKRDRPFTYPNGHGHGNPVTISVSEGCLIRAVAYKNPVGSPFYKYSNIANQFYPVGSADTVQDGAVSFSPGGGVYEGAQRIVLFSGPGWKICYTTDGSSPISREETPQGLGNSNLVTVELAGSCIIKAVAYKQLDTAVRKYQFSNVAVQTYNIHPAGTVTVEDVSFFPGGGVYEDTQQIVLFCDPDWKICYTTDGSSPISEFNRPQGLGNSNPVTVELAESCTIKAVAYKPVDPIRSKYEFSDVAEQTYEIHREGTVTVGAVSFLPGGGVYEGAQEIELSCDPGWKISYTTDGSSPISILNSPQGLGNSNPVTVELAGSCTIKAVAYKQLDRVGMNYEFSDVAEQTYEIHREGIVTVGAVSFLPGGGVYEGAQEIELSCNPGWKISYTTDGSSPISSNNKPQGLGNSNLVTVELTESCTLKAVAYKLDNPYKILPEYMFSDIAEQDYYIVDPYSISLYAPVFGSVFEGYSLPEPETLTVVSTGTGDVTITSVALSGPDADCFVLNNTDGMWISAGGIDNVSYSIGIIDGLAAGTYTATVTAEYNGGKTASTEVSCTVNEWDAAAAPVISPAAGTYSAVQQVELFCSTEDAFIYYTTDGTEPDSVGNGILYTGPITVFTDTTVKAIAVKPGLKRSTVAEAAYTMDLTLFYGANDVFLGAEYQPVSFRFTSAGDGVYRFYSDSQEISPSIMVYDGDDQIEYHTGMYQSHHCIAELEGGKEYTVKIESLYGTGNITVRVNPTRLYSIFADPSIEHGTVTVSQGALPAADSGTLGRAYAGAEVYFSAEPEEGYGLADFSVVNTVGRVLSREPAVIMPWGGVTVRAHFDTVHMLSWPSEEETDEHANLEVVWINDSGLGAWGEGREVVRGQTVGLRWTFDEGYDADAFTLVTAGGTPVDWTYAWDNDNKKIIQFTMPGEDVYTAMTSRAFSFDNADFILPAETRSVEANAFQGDTYITSVVIPDLCGSIGQEAFKDCTNLSYIRIPQGCQIGEDAFDGCRWVRIYGTEGSPAWQYCQDHDNCTFVKE